MQLLSSAQLRDTQGGTGPIIGDDAFQPGGIFSGTTVYNPNDDTTVD